MPHALTLRRSLKPDAALLVGRLRVHGVGRRPYLSLVVHCPYCREGHLHSWPDPPTRADAVSHRAAHCAPSSPLYRTGYYVGLDGAQAERNRAAIAEWEKAIRPADLCTAASE